MSLVSDVKSVFEKEFDKLVEVISRAPGRVNIIGEHTDYNGGFVLPASIDKEMVMALSKNDSGQVNVIAVDMKERDQFQIDSLEAKDGWVNYVIGVTSEMVKKGVKLEGYDLAFGGNVPLGAGMSSSAALECALATGLNTLFDGGLSQIEIAELSQQAEHNYAGVKCGIMDQFASTFGKKNQVIRLDCRSLEYQYHTIDIKNYQFILLDTNVKHSLASSAYNDRKAECQTGVKALQKKYPKVELLRDATVAMLDEVKEEVDAIVYHRCRYIIEENQRVVEACGALDKDDFIALGELMYGSHQGLSKSYEVSCEELDFLVDQTKDNSQILGSRMMGGGFGGCTINLIEENAVDAFVEKTNKAYKEKFGKEITVYPVIIGDGARVDR